MPSQTMVWAQSMLGQTLKGQYRLEGILGEGAMGVVFRGVNLAMGKVLAVKMMRKEAFDTPDAVERFTREARVWSQLNHPTITQVFDFGVHDGQPLLVMELVEGVDLSEVLKQEKLLEPLRAVKLMRQLASGLEEAHRLGVVHRDIKPQNLKLLRYQPGGKMVLKVLDFGMAKQVGKADQRLTAPGILVGTPKYVAPEQITENPLIDGRTDLYACGVLFYELLTGDAPFLGTPAEVLFAHLGSEAKPLPDTVPYMVREVVYRLLRKKPDERFANASALEQSLEECEMTLRALTMPNYSSGMYAAVNSGPHHVPVRPSSATPAPLTPPSANSLRSAAAALAATPNTPALGITPPSVRSNPAPSSLSQPSGPNNPPLPSVRSNPSVRSTPSQRSQPSTRSHPSGPTPVPPSSSGPSQPVATEIATPQPSGWFTRTLLGTVFIVTMLASGALFYGMRHYLPLQRTVATWVSAYKVPQDEEVALTLRSLEGDREKHQWAAVLRGVQFLEQRYGETMLPEQVASMNTLRIKAQLEQPLEEVYQKIVVAATRPDSEEVMRLYAQLPPESLYRQMAQTYYNAAVESYVATHLSKAEELRVAGRCDEYLTEIQKLHNAVPGHPQARGAERKECPPPAAATADLGTAVAPTQ